MYRRPRKTQVQLTSLLDLLFVMIFVSLIQQKEIPKNIIKKKVAKPVVSKPTVAKDYSISAVFNFSGSGLKGSFLMKGVFSEKKDSLQLGGVSWIKRPSPQYDMVPLSGKINPKLGIFRGRIEFPGCKDFTLKRDKNSGKGSPVAGVWKGSYRCLQGQTNLRLEID